MADKKIVDVASPTDSKVDIGSKPMIIGHKSMASDPMVREKQVNEAIPEASVEESKESTSTVPDTAPKDDIVSAEKVEPPSTKQKTIEPIVEEKKPEEKMVVSEELKAEEPKPEEPKPVEPDKSEKAKEELDETALELEKEENLRKIIESKKYQVSIKQSRGENKSWIYVLIGLIITAVIALFILIDTGKLDVGFKLPFTLFGEKTTTVDQNPIVQNQDISTQNASDNQQEIEIVPEATTDLSQVIFPNEWGVISEDKVNGYFTFDQLEQFSLKVSNQPVGTKTDVAISVTSECVFTETGEWDPVPGEFSTPEECIYDTRFQNGTNIYIFEKEAVGRYVFTEIFEINGSLFQLSQESDYPQDYNTDSDEAEIKEGVKERVKTTLQQRTTELISSN